ncbi:MAG: hypothetical protein ACR2MT_08980, partial [Aurantibacter sp.]
MKFSSRRTKYFLISFLTIVPVVVFSQEEVNKEPIKLYTDCNCEKSYLRQEINYVSHVRDQAQANVKLFIYDIANGSGGRTYRLEFEGTEDYEGIFEGLSYDSNANMTQDEVRKGLLKKVQSGLLRYLLESDMAENINYSIDNKGMGEIQDIDFNDPWNNWIFEVYGEAEVDKESSRKKFAYEIGFESDRVTEKWRIRSDFQLNQANSEFIRNDETFTSERFRYSGDGSIVRS